MTCRPETTMHIHTMKKRWISVAHCVETILGNFAVVGLAVAAYEQKIWPAFPVAVCAALAAIIFAWVVPHD